ncbi:hypothetical protein CUMW_207110 [Citrus unshiu]|uniref:30S ribosomal protein S21, chloroplastic n=1 Tax=Citrus unshiu TaxID=55188 RepID=A0A2H5Q8Y6_CITUN|nr:hypothetical protein CUMW_207110 [Citrus unshiu]GAY61098.1 hypothetical protein CUMW_207110 [Citrus unshiu]
MATPLSNFFSFILPSNALPKNSTPLAQPNHLSVSSQQKPKNALFSKVAPAQPQESHDSSSSSSSSTELASVICPSLAYANTLFFKSAYNVQVVVDENEPEERLLNRFRREVMRAGVIQECKRRRFFETKQDEKKRKTREAAKRNRRRRSQFRVPVQNRQEATPTKKDDDDEDNWELPEGGIPY